MRADNDYEKEISHMVGIINDLEDINAELLAAIKLGGFALGPCHVCGKQVVFLEDGLPPMCENCAGGER